MKSGIKVFAPASVGNVGIGFDCLGLCLDKPGDEIIAKFSDEFSGLRITEITGAKGKLPTDPERNTAGVAALRLLEHLGEQKRGIEFRLHKKMPFGSGLGSSAASAVAGAMAINELFRRPLEKRALLPFAMAGEEIASGSRHADNVAPSLLGGLILIRDNASLDVHRLPLLRGLQVVVIYPHIEIMTEEARALLSPNVSLADYTQQSANLASFTVAAYTGDLDLMQRSLNDIIIEPQRKKLIPGFDEAKAAALHHGALGCSISGSGPSIFALCQNSLVAENVAGGIQSIFDQRKIQSQRFISGINQEGAVKC